MKGHALTARVTLGLLCAFGCVHRTIAEEAPTPPLPLLRDLRFCGVAQVGTNVVACLVNTRDRSSSFVAPGQATPGGLLLQEAWPFEGKILVRLGQGVYVISLSRSTPVHEKPEAASHAYGGVAKEAPLSFIIHIQALLSAESGQLPAEVRRVSPYAWFNTRGPVTREAFTSLIEGVLQKQGNAIDLRREQVQAMQDDINALHKNVMLAAGTDEQQRLKIEEIARMPPSDATIRNLTYAPAALDLIMVNQVKKQNRYEELSPVAGSRPAVGRSRTYGERLELRKQMLRRMGRAASEGIEDANTNTPASQR